MKRWTQDEVDLIKRGKSDLEIMQLTGRSALGVIAKRREMADDTEGTEGFAIPPCMRLTQTEKIERINILAEKYGVRLL